MSTRSITIMKDDGSGVSYIYTVEAGYNTPIVLTCADYNGTILYKGNPEDFKVEEES